MSAVRRVYVEKKAEFAVRSKELTEEIRSYLDLKSVNEIRVLVPKQNGRNSAENNGQNGGTESGRLCGKQSARKTLTLGISVYGDASWVWSF